MRRRMGDDALLAASKPVFFTAIEFKACRLFSPFRLLHHFQQTKDASFVIMNEKSVFQKALKSWLFLLHVLCKMS